ncbi:hypothetical protein HYD57_02320 [Mycoplasmopsis bovis]|nr:hypothetical protein [Mycoplasmopsis bovis]QQH66356.1 hypothetical protein HYD57_02320 [Mycoplasmopsis bovis]
MLKILSKQGSTITSKNKDWFFRRNKAINIELRTNSEQEKYNNETARIE